MISFIKHKNIFFVLTLAAIAAAVAAISVWGLRPGIEFTGGSLTIVEYHDARPETGAIREKVQSLGLADASVYAVEEKGAAIRTENLSAQRREALLAALKETGEFEEKSFESIGPMVGRELTGKMSLLVLVSLLAMLLYIAVAFRNVPGQIGAWQFGAASFLILCHDILIPLGIFAALGAFWGVQITIPVITALLIVVGYAINNVIVVYDRVRENLLRDRRVDFAENANRAINQTLSRQINTSLATLLPVFAIYFLGGESLKYFSLALILGVAVGTYSSVFLSAQMLVLWRQIKMRRKNV